ncbi:MAG: hypothetical protein H0V44_15825 [Planctomycetes bacterium]|nr:hypothetical protein [Planctomycetota bacterium]
MDKTLWVIIGSQLLFSTSDFMARYYMKGQAFCVATFVSVWFAIYFIIRTIAMFGMLYAFTTVPLGRTMGLLSMTGLVVANVLGLLLLKEVLTPVAYIGLALGMIALFLLAWK